MSTRTAILVVNGFDRAGMLGTHFDPSDALRYPWIDICLRQIRRHSASREHEVFVWDNSQMPELRALIAGHGAHLLPSDSRLAAANAGPTRDAVARPYVFGHAASLQTLMLEVGEEFEYVVTLDSDAFPVRDDWLAVLHKNLETASLTGVWRDEMPGHLSPFVHPSGLCIRRERLIRIERPFAYSAGTAVGHAITADVLAAGETIMPLKRTNARNAHFLIGGIYGDVIYHHGAGSRAPVFWMTEGEAREGRIHATLRDAVFADLDHVLAVLRGESNDDLGLEWNSEVLPQSTFVERPSGMRSPTNAVVRTSVEATWLDELPHEMAVHAGHLRKLLDLVRRDPRMRALQVQGSIGRGTGDRLSDLDVGLVVAEDAWPAITGEIPAVLRAMGDVVDEHNHWIPSNEQREVFKGWAHFIDGVEADLLVLPTTKLLGSGPDGRTLYDPDALLVRTDHPKRLATPEDIADWSFLAWQNLIEVAKYIERDRPVAAAEWLNSARAATISCWAAVNGAEYSAYANVAAGQLGVTVPWPAGLDEAYPKPESASVLAAALAVASVQERADRMLTLRFAAPERPLAVWASTRLAQLQSNLEPLGSPRARSSRRGKPRAAADPLAGRRPRPRAR